MRELAEFAQTRAFIIHKMRRKILRKTYSANALKDHIALKHPVKRHTTCICEYIHKIKREDSRLFYLKPHLSIIITITSISPHFQNFFMIRYLFDCLNFSGGQTQWCARIYRINVHVLVRRLAGASIGFELGHMS